MHQGLVFLAELPEPKLNHVGLLIDPMTFQAQHSQRHGNRRFNRLRLGVPAILALTHGKIDCLIDDISATGARLRLARPLAAGTATMLVFHQLEAFGAVVWSRDGECALRFDRPLDPEDMQGMLWITENRELYERICRDELIEAWVERG